MTSGRIVTMSMPSRAIIAMSVTRGGVFAVAMGLSSISTVVIMVTSSVVAMGVTSRTIIAMSMSSRGVITVAMTLSSIGAVVVMSGIRLTTIQGSKSTRNCGADTREIGGTELAIQISNILNHLGYFVKYGIVTIRRCYSIYRSPCSSASSVARSGTTKIRLHIVSSSAYFYLVNN